MVWIEPHAVADQPEAWAVCYGINGDDLVGLVRYVSGGLVAVDGDFRTTVGG